MGIAMKQDIPSKEIALRHASNWAFPSDIPTDVTVTASGMPFALHKFPLVSRSGWIRRYVNDARSCHGLLRIDFHDDLPGGAEAFELAARFCYGVEVDINEANVAVVRCAAEYLDMSDEYGDRNLISETEEWLTNALSHATLSTAVRLLQSCKSVLAMAEELSMVERCIEAAVREARGWSGEDAWWGQELGELCIEFFERVVRAMAMAGVGSEVVAGSIVSYAQRALGGKAMVMGEGERRRVVEKLVGVMPWQRGTFSTAFLFGLLRLVMEMEAREECRMELERRIGWQLEQGSLDDLLIPSTSYSSTATLFNIDVVARMVRHFLSPDGAMHQDGLPHLACSSLPSPSSVMKVARLMDCYLAEIAPDANLTIHMFISLGELLPDYARVLDDGLYRAIDIYLKAHPALNELERKKLCRLMDYQKLSQEACAHAAQNERLPVQAAMQVLYFEQSRLRKAISVAGKGGAVGWREEEEEEEEEEDEMSERMMSSETLSSGMSPSKEEYGRLRKENMQLKEEVQRMRRRMTEMEEEEEEGEGRQERKKKRHRHPLPPPRTGFLHTLSKKLGWFNPFQRPHAASKHTKAMARKARRHSIS